MNDDVSTLSRQLARAALAWPFDPQALAITTPREAVVTAIERYKAALTPAAKLSREDRAEDQQRLAENIRAIGLRIRPDFSPDQAKLWIAAMVQALEAQPLRIAISASADAMSKPIQFPGEVLGKILECAEPHNTRYRTAIRNLERLLAVIDAPPKIEASPEAKAEAQRITEDELQSMDASLRSLGLAGGWLIEGPDGRLRYATDGEMEARQQSLSDERGVARAGE